jgi:hypothetical protein
MDPFDYSDFDDGCGGDGNDATDPMAASTSAPFDYGDPVAPASTFIDETFDGPSASDPFWATEDVPVVEVEPAAIEAPLPGSVPFSLVPPGAETPDGGIDYNALMPGGGSGLGDLLNFADSYGQATQDWIDDLEVEGVDTGGFGLNTAAGQAINIVNAHMEAADDVLHGDFKAADRIAGWTPFLAGYNASEAAHEQAMSTYRDPAEKLVEYGNSVNEYERYAAEQYAIGHGAQVQAAAEHSAWLADWAVWLSRLYGHS